MEDTIDITRGCGFPLKGIEQATAAGITNGVAMDHRMGMRQFQLQEVHTQTRESTSAVNRHRHWVSQNALQCGRHGFTRVAGKQTSLNPRFQLGQKYFPRCGEYFQSRCLQNIFRPYVTQVTGLENLVGWSAGRNATLYPCLPLEHTTADSMAYISYSL